MFLKAHLELINCLISCLVEVFFKDQSNKILKTSACSENLTF